MPAHKHYTSIPEQHYNIKTCEHIRIYTAHSRIPIFHLTFNFNDPKSVSCVKFPTVKIFLSLMLKYCFHKKTVKWFHCVYYIHIALLQIFREKSQNWNMASHEWVDEMTASVQIVQILPSFINFSLQLATSKATITSDPNILSNYIGIKSFATCSYKTV